MKQIVFPWFSGNFWRVHSPPFGSNKATHTHTQSNHHEGIQSNAWHLVAPIFQFLWIELIPLGISQQLGFGLSELHPKHCYSLVLRLHDVLTDVNEIRIMRFRPKRSWEEWSLTATIRPEFNRKFAWRCSGWAAPHGLPFRSGPAERLKYPIDNACLFFLFFTRVSITCLARLIVSTVLD